VQVVVRSSAAWGIRRGDPAECWVKRRMGEVKERHEATRDADREW
jgi:hypothetical protein